MSMAFEFSSEVQELIARHMATGQYSSENELLAAALDSMEIDDVDEEEVAAIRAGLDAIERGEPSVPLEEAFAELRQRNGIAPGP